MGALPALDFVLFGMAFPEKCGAKGFDVEGFIQSLIFMILMGLGGLEAGLLIDF